MLFIGRIYIKFYFSITFSNFLQKICIFFQIPHEVLHYLNSMKKLGILNNLNILNRKIGNLKIIPINILDVCTTLDQSFYFGRTSFFAEENDV